MLKALTRKLSVNPIPPWIYPVVLAFVGAVVGYFQQNGNGVLTKQVLVGALVAGVSSVLGLLKQLPPPTVILLAVLGLSATTSACAAWKPVVDPIVDFTEAECEKLDDPSAPPSIVTVVCDVVNAAGDIVKVFEVKDTPEKAAALLAAHPVKTGHPRPSLELSKAAQ